MSGGSWHHRSLRCCTRSGTRWPMGSPTAWGIRSDRGVLNRRLGRRARAGAAAVGGAALRSRLSADPRDLHPAVVGELPARRVQSGLPGRPRYRAPGGGGDRDRAGPRPAGVAAGGDRGDLARADQPGPRRRPAVARGTARVGCRGGHRNLHRRVHRHRRRRCQHHPGAGLRGLDVPVPGTGHAADRTATAWTWPQIPGAAGAVRGARRRVVSLAAYGLVLVARPAGPPPRSPRCGKPASSSEPSSALCSSENASESVGWSRPRWSPSASSWSTCDRGGWRWCRGVLRRAAGSSAATVRDDP